MENNVVKIEEERQARLARGGNGPPGYGGGKDWLCELGQGTRFLAKRKGDNSSEVEEYIIGAKLAGVADVFLIQNSQPFTIMKWHDTKNFSRINELRYILEVIDGNDKQIRQRPMAGNESPEVRLGIPPPD